MREIRRDPVSGPSAAGAISRLFGAVAIARAPQTFGRSPCDNIAAITAFERGDATGSPEASTTRVINLIETAILAPGK